MDKTGQNDMQKDNEKGLCHQCILSVTSTFCEFCFEVYKKFIFTTRALASIP